jgi:hypothetical protein
VRNICVILVIIASFVASCQKEISGEVVATPDNAGKQCPLTRIVQGTGIDDTVYLVKYDALNRIRAIVDSVHEDSLNATFTGNNKYPDRIEDSFGDGISYSYNNAGKPLVVVGWGNKVEMEYVSDTVLSKAITYYPDNGWKIASRYTFQFDSKSNLTQIQEFSSGNVFQHQIDITYTDIPNAFQGLVPYNFFNLLGMDDIFPASMFLYNSKYMVKSATIEGLTYGVTYQLNNTRQVIASKAVLKNTSTEEIFYVATRSYFYQCP